jgi:nitrogen fixation protein FixH
MEHIYEEIKNQHHLKYRVPAAVISSIMFSFLITVFLLMTNNSIKSPEQVAQNLFVTSNTANTTTAVNAANN